MRYPRRFMGYVFMALLAAHTAWAQTHDRGSASVFLYHRFDEARFPSTNISVAQFQAHINELTSGPYHVMPLGEIVESLISGKPLPEQAVAITIDDGFLSFYRHAWPLLRKAGLPFTLFISTDALDEKQKGAISWDQLREMIAGGRVTIGHHGAAHLHMPQKSEAVKRADIEKARARFAAELGLQPEIFAYPYGEYSKADRALIMQMGFRAAFAEPSGPVHHGADIFALPRFVLNDQYGEAGRFRLAARALPLPVHALTPEDPVLAPGNNPPLIGFIVDEGVTGLERLACYASHQTAPLALNRLGGGRIEARLQKPFPRGHGRINCTLPAGNGRWRWLGQVFAVP